MDGSNRCNGRHVLDKVLLLLARGVDGRGGTDNLLWAAGGVDDTAEEGGEDTEGELCLRNGPSVCISFPLVVLFVAFA